MRVIQAVLLGIVVASLVTPPFVASAATEADEARLAQEAQEAERARIALEAGTTLPLPPPVSAATEDSGKKFHSPPRPEGSERRSHSSSSTARLRTCGPVRGETVIANDRTRIYSLSGSRPPQTERIFGCLVSTGRVRQLSPIGKSKFPVRMSEPFVLRAPWVGGVERAHGFDSLRLGVRAVNLRTGAVSVCFVGSGLAPRSAGEVMRIALMPNGSLAWAGKGHFGSAGKHPPSPEIVACDSEGDRVLDSGEGIDLHSLTLHGSELTWSSSGIKRTAVLH